MISLDGFFEGPNHELDWHNVDTEFNNYAVQQLDSASLLLFGRRTYEMMASYWPVEIAQEDDPIVSKRMNNMPKMVFSKTIDKIEWENTKLAKDDLVKTISDLKSKPGKDLLILGSSNLSKNLIELGLLDEIRLMINPIVLGNGNKLFEGIKQSLSLKLASTRQFDSGNVLLTYTLQNTKSA